MTLLIYGYLSMKIFIHKKKMQRKVESLSKENYYTKKLEHRMFRLKIVKSGGRCFQFPKIRLQVLAVCLQNFK